MAGSNQPLSLNAPENPLDKIFYKPETFSVAVAQSANPIAPTITTVTIANSQATTFFMDMQVSVDNATWYDSGLEPYYKDPVTLSIHQNFSGYWYMTSSTISFGFFANQAAYTIYYRLVGYSKE